MDLGLKGKSAVVTGASAGLGRATAAALSREGVRVAICGRHQDTIEKAAREIEEETHTEVFPYVADVSKKSDVENFITAAIDRFGGIDILINNADADKPEGDFFDIPDEDWLEKVNTKLLAHIRAIRLVVPGMKERGWGRIIAIGGGSSRSPEQHSWTKGSVTAGLMTMMKKLSVRVGAYGITANVLEPGRMWSDGITRGGKTRAEVRQEQLAKKAEEAGVSVGEMEQRFLDGLVIRRRVTAEDGAGIIVFLASVPAATITGEVILANGGETKYVRF